LPVGPAALRQRPPRCKVLFAIIVPARGAGQEFGKPGIARFPEIGAVSGMAGSRFAGDWGVVTGAAEYTRQKCRERMTGFVILGRRLARRD
jgi:hypothetical protein